MEALSRVIQADDRLELVALKVKPRRAGQRKQRALPLAVGYKTRMEYSRDDTGKVVIYSYSKEESGKTVFTSPEKIAEMTEQERKSWSPNFERVYFTPLQGITVIERGNELKVRMVELSKTMKSLLASRYRLAVDCVTALYPDLLRFTFQRMPANERRRTERARQVLKRRFKVKEYEYNAIILDRELGAAVYAELEAAGRKRPEWDTLYLQGFDKEAIRVKYYSMSECHGLGSGTYKLEVTLKGSELEKYGITIADLTTQEESIQRVRTLAINEIMKATKGKGGAKVQELQMRLFAENEVLARLLRLEEKQAKTEEKQAETDERLAEHDRMIQELAELVKNKRQMAGSRRTGKACPKTGSTRG